jgi:hypothetical protein
MKGCRNTGGGVYSGGFLGLTLGAMIMPAQESRMKNID